MRITINALNIVCFPTMQSAKRAIHDQKSLHMSEGTCLLLKKVDNFANDSVRKRISSSSIERKAFIPFYNKSFEGTFIMLFFALIVERL